ncbi:MAG: segregation/condensation protein A [Sphaerochaetaceae bacterium]|nr:segregation/condensation protein A [Sphaerochaetaceae bacterium]
MEISGAGETLFSEANRNHLTYSVQQFEGPLDLLLHLIQKSQVSIYSIPIAEITDQFLEYLEMAKRIDLEDLTDFYHMAAQLLFIKSNMLLPRELSEDDDFDDGRDELVQQLLEYQKYKKYSVLLAQKNQGDQLFIQRKKSQFMLPFTDDQLWSEISVWDLLKTFSSILNNLSVDQVFNVYEEVTVKQKITLMNELFGQKESITFSDLLVDKTSPLEIICAFLAILEAVKFNMIVIEQHRLFGDIQITRSAQIDESIIYKEEILHSDLNSDSIDVEIERYVADEQKEILEEEIEDDDDELIIELTEEDQ